MTAISPEASRQAAVESALLVLERMGLSPADLAAVPQPRQPVPTFAEYVPIVSVFVDIRGGGTRPPFHRGVLPLQARVGPRGVPDGQMVAERQ